MKRIRSVEVAVPVAEAGVELQWLSEPQRLVQAEPQQYAVGEPDTAGVAPPAGGVPHFGGRRVGQIAVEPSAVGQDRLGAGSGGGPLGQDAPERRGVVALGCRGVLGDRLQPDHFADAAAAGRGDGVEIGYPRTESGVHQPIRHPGGGQEAARHLVVAQLATTGPVVVGLGVPRKVEQRRAVGADGEADLSVERRVERRQRFGIALVQPVLEVAAVARSQPVPVHVVVDQRHRCGVLRQRGHQTLQDSRNLCASSSSERSPYVSPS